MKRSIYTALLLTLVFFFSSEMVQSQTRRVYRSVNNKADQNEQPRTSTSPSSTPSQTIQTQSTGRSTLQADPGSNARRSQSLYQERTETAGKAVPEPRVAGSAVRRRSASETVEKPTSPLTPPLATTPLTSTQPQPQPTATPVQTAPEVRQVTTAPAVRQVTTASQPYQQQPYQQQPPSSYQSFSDSDWKLFRNVRVSLLSESDKVFFKKYSVVLGSFRSFNNADFVRRTFNGLGERVIVVKGLDTGNYYVLVSSFDDQTSAVQKLENFTRQYTTGMSRAKRISRYGVSLDDLWIMINSN